MPQPRGDPHPDGGGDWRRIPRAVRGETLLRPGHAFRQLHVVRRLFRPVRDYLHTVPEIRRGRGESLLLDRHLCRESSSAHGPHRWMLFLFRDIHCID